MPQPTCRRCRPPLRPVHPGQQEHPLCSPAADRWIPRAAACQTERPGPGGGPALAIQLAAAGWHIVPLSPASKRPLANCPACRDRPAGPPHRIGDCPCLPAGRWCHGVRAATTDLPRITAWWRNEPAAVPCVAAGPSGLVLIDIDSHGDELPADLATGLLPGIDLATEPIPPDIWSEPARLRDGGDTLRLLARVRGGPHPGPAMPSQQPVTVATPSGGRHLCYRAPAPGLRQALSGPRGLAWQVDIKAGWPYGVAPSATTPSGTYQILSGDPAEPGRMPAWLAREISRVSTPRPARPIPAPAALPYPPGRAAAYLTAVIDRGAARIAAMSGGWQRALSALAYQTGGLLTWSGLPHDQVTDRLSAAGAASGLRPALARRIVTRALERGLSQPITPPPACRTA